MRTCTNCNKPMNEGYVWGDGEGYACSDECLYVDGYTKEQFDIDYQNDCIYWTQWEGKTSLKHILRTQFNDGEFTFFAVMTHHHEGEGLELWKKEFYRLLETGFIEKTGQRQLGAVYKFNERRGKK